MSALMALRGSDGSRVLVDADVWPLVRGRHWEAFRPQGGGPYFRSYFGKRNQVSLHRVLAGAVKGQTVDHVNGDTLDNRRANLRLCVPRQNAANCRKKGGDSPYKGVYRNKSIGAGKIVGRPIKPWRAQIMVDRKSISLGGFDTAEDAARAYDAAAVQHHGEFARTNAMLGLLR